MLGALMTIFYVEFHASRSMCHITIRRRSV